MWLEGCWRIALNWNINPLLGWKGDGEGRRALTCAGDALCENDESLMLTSNGLDKREWVTLYEDDRLLGWLQLRPVLFWKSAAMLGSLGVRSSTCFHWPRIQKTGQTGFRKWYQMTAHFPLSLYFVFLSFCVFSFISPYLYLFIFSHFWLLLHFTSHW